MEDEVLFVESSRLGLGAGLEGLKYAGHLMEFGDGLGSSVLKLVEVVLDFAADEGLGLFALMTMVHSLDGGLETERDEQADGDGEEVEEEIAGAVDSVFGGWTSSMSGLLGFPLA